jgi:catechol 2,3-dioxygenase-like lactoylglutathione lyase family enzyme
MGAPAKEGNMIDHVSIGVRDIAEAKAFYDAALKGEGQSVTIPVRCTHQARAVSLDDLTHRTPSWSEP